MEDGMINPEETALPWRDIGIPNMEETFLYPQTVSRTLKSTKIREYLNQSFPGVLKCLHTVGFGASALNIYHSMLSKMDANWF